MQTKKINDMKRALESKVDTMIDSTLREISEFYVGLQNMRIDIINEREGLDELDEYGNQLDDVLHLVEEAQAALSPYSEMYEDVFHNLDVVSCKLARDLTEQEQEVSVEV